MGKPTNAIWSLDWGLWRGKKAEACLLLVSLPIVRRAFSSSPPSPNPASLDLKQASVKGRELFSEIQVLKLFISLPYNVFPLLIMMLDASERRIKSPRSN